MIFPYEIYDLYNTALNKDTYQFYNVDNTWQYVRCAVDHTRKVFRISSYEDYTVSDEDKANGVKYQYANNEKELEPEILHGNTRTVRPFRFFDIKKTSYVKFEHFNINYSRQYMKQFKLFREYIDFRIEDIKSINWWTNTNFIVFGYLLLLLILMLSLIVLLMITQNIIVEIVITVVCIIDIMTEKIVVIIKLDI